MNKSMPNLPFWNRNPVHHQLALPLFVLGGLLIVSGVATASFAPIAVGVIGVVAGIGLERN